MTLYLIAALAVVFNVGMVIWKATSSRKLNAAIDFLLLAAVIALFQGSEGLLIIGVIASALISIMLIFMIPKQVPSEPISLTPTEIAKWLDKQLS